MFKKLLNIQKMERINKKLRKIIAIIKLKTYKWLKTQYFVVESAPLFLLDIE